MHVGTRTTTTSGRQRHSTVGSGNYSADHATAHRDADRGSDAHSGPRADPDNGTGANCDFTSAHGNPYRRATYTDLGAHRTAGAADRYIDSDQFLNGPAHHGVGHPANLPAYNRDDWKHWTDADGDCQDARQEVLVAESRITVSYETDRRCRVTSGQWLAPYSNVVVTEPGKLDVDHMVPLGNAHLSGAWRWNAAQRERYANHLADPQHLIAVTRGANRSKGAHGPDEWKPEDRTYWCQYAIDWITIKDTWDLTVTEPEHGALAQMLSTCATPPQLMTSGQNQGAPVPGATSTPVPSEPTPTPQTRTYHSCDAAQAAGEPRIQGSKGGGRGFPKWMVPSARDGDGDGVVCEK